jgi:hypothetical protein
MDYTRVDYANGSNTHGPIPSSVVADGYGKIVRYRESPQNEWGNEWSGPVQSGAPLADAVLFGSLPERSGEETYATQVGRGKGQFSVGRPVLFSDKPRVRIVCRDEATIIGVSRGPDLEALLN